MTEAETFLAFSEIRCSVGKDEICPICGVVELTAFSRFTYVGTDTPTRAANWRKLTPMPNQEIRPIFPPRLVILGLRLNVK